MTTEGIDLEETSRAVIDLIASKNATYNEAMCVLKWVENGMKEQKVQKSAD